MKVKPELLIRASCINAEGPVWDDETQTLYFIDVEAGRIFSFKDQHLTVWNAGEKTGCAVITADGGIIAALQSGFYRVDFPNGGKTFLTDPEADLPRNRFNDGKVDPRGRFFAGTLTMEHVPGKEAEAALYRLVRVKGCGQDAENGEYTAKKVLDNVGLSNGLAWSADGTKFYFADTDRSTITEYAYDMENGEIGDGKVIIRVPKEMGFPDGMTIDEEGKLWIALWNGGALSRWDPESGTLLEKYELPAKNVSSCCFGGPNMDELFITTASQDTDLTQYPLAGNVFHLFPGVKGAKSFRLIL